MKKFFEKNILEKPAEFILQIPKMGEGIVIYFINANKQHGIAFYYQHSNQPQLFTKSILNKMMG